MGQPSYDSSESSYQNPYGEILKVAPRFEGLLAEKIAQTHPLGAKFVVDGLSLEDRSTVEYERLRGELVEHVSRFRSDQSYASVAVNEFGDRFLTILDYVNLLGSNPRANPEKVERLKLDVTKAFIQKMPASAWLFIEGAEMESLYQRAEAELARQMSPMTH